MFGDIFGAAVEYVTINDMRLKLLKKIKGLLHRVEGYRYSATTSSIGALFSWCTHSIISIINLLQIPYYTDYEIYEPENHRFRHYIQRLIVARNIFEHMTFLLIDIYNHAAGDSNRWFERRISVDEIHKMVEDMDEILREMDEYIDLIKKHGADSLLKRELQRSGYEI